MAEIAIPLIALGSLFIASNNKNSNRREGMESLEEKSSVKREPKYVEVKNPTTIENNGYVNSNQHTDKYFVNDPIQETPQQKAQHATAMTSDGFKHNNMVPFFGSKMRGPTLAHDSILDTMQGSGTLQKKKEAQAPLFKPEKNMNFQNGMPTNTEFYQNRMNTGLRNANVKPWEEEKVAPGLNLGYTTQGSGGFNSGMEQREQWQPKTVDDLRVKTNQKESFMLVDHEGPVNAPIKQRGMMGKAEKNNPDAFYINTPDRWAPANSADFKKAAEAGAQPDRQTYRAISSVEYTGGAMNSVSATYSDQNYQESKNINLPSLPVSNLSTTAKSGLGDNYGKDSYKILNNNRSVNSNDGYMGQVKGILGQVVSPFIDILRPTRKQDLIEAGVDCARITRKTQNLVETRNEKAPDYTMREMNGNNNHMFIERQGTDGYIVSNPYLKDKKQQGVNGYLGGANGRTKEGAMLQDDIKNQRNNPYKEATTFNRLEHSVNPVFNNEINMSVRKNENDIIVNRSAIKTGGRNAIVGVEQVELNKLPQSSNYNSDRLDGSLLDAIKKNPYTHNINMR